jgi:alpha-beta hydrolase superfamily lysophospholipase
MPAGGEIPNLDAIRRATLPTLIIHGQYDSLIPPSAAEELYANSGADDKRLVIIPNADHNDVMAVDMARYFGAIRDFVAGAT